MKTAIILGPKQIEIREVDLPPLQADEVLVKVKAVGLCTWEQRFYLGVDPQGYPFRGGHEVTGQVIEVGPEAKTEARPGDTVCLALKTVCGSCYYCRRGLDNFCLNAANNNRPGQVWGPAGLSEYVIAKDNQIFKANPELDPALLALAEPVACVIRSVSLPTLQFGDVVVIQGLGVMGLIHLQLLKQRGVRIAAIEPDPRRREMALARGADWAIDPYTSDPVTLVRNKTNGLGAQAVFFTGGGGSAIEQGMAALAKGGWLCLYGSVHPAGLVEIDPNEIHYKELFFSGTFSHTRSSFRQAVATISTGLIDLSPLVSERIPFSELERGFELAVRTDTYRVIMTF